MWINIVISVLFFVAGTFLLVKYAKNNNQWTYTWGWCSLIGFASFLPNCFKYFYSLELIHKLIVLCIIIIPIGLYAWGLIKLARKYYSACKKT